jgi:glycosyltransferase involved in cell wall biosynthesis
LTTISVAMATFNGARFIRAQLESIAHQTFQPVELIIADDGSTDSTLEIIASFASTAPFPIRVYQNENCLGYKENFLRCAGLCSGALIAFSDQDDIWLETKLESQVRAFDDPEVLLSCHNVELMDEGGRRSGHTLTALRRSGKYTYRQMLPFALSFGFTQTFRRSLLSLFPYWQYSNRASAGLMAHDEYYFFLASIMGTVNYDHEVRALYRQHGRNVSGQKQKNTIVRAISEKLASQKDDYTRFVDNSIARARILESIVSDVEERDSMLTKRMSAAAKAYSSLGLCHSRRLDLYNNNGALRRARALYSLCVSGDYGLRADPWRLTMFGFVKDALVVLLGSRSSQE